MIAALASTELNLNEFSKATKDDEEEEESGDDDDNSEDTKKENSEESELAKNHGRDKNGLFKNHKNYV
jgi:hypothetical protein